MDLVRFGSTFRLPNPSASAATGSIPGGSFKIETTPDPFFPNRTGVPDKVKAKLSI
jgi:hypothetical protein